MNAKTTTIVADTTFTAAVVDGTLHIDGRPVGEVSNPAGAGSIDQWASPEVVEFIDADSEPRTLARDIRGVVEAALA